MSTELSHVLQELRDVRQPSHTVLQGARVLFPCELLSALSLLQTSAQAGYQAVVETGLGLAIGLREQILKAAAILVWQIHPGYTSNLRMNIGLMWSDGCSRRCCVIVAYIHNRVCGLGTCWCRLRRLHCVTVVC